MFTDEYSQSCIFGLSLISLYYFKNNKEISSFSKISPRIDHNVSQTPKTCPQNMLAAFPTFCRSESSLGALMHLNLKSFELEGNLSRLDLMENNA